jgi:hypothetical protein
VFGRERARTERDADDVYEYPSGYQERARYVMTKDPATSVWSRTVSVATLRDTYGITGSTPGPNWPSSYWTKGSTAGFIADVDEQGNRFNPNKLAYLAFDRERDPRPGLLSDQPAAELRLLGPLPVLRPGHGGGSIHDPLLDLLLGR